MQNQPPVTQPTVGVDVVIANGRRSGGDLIDVHVRNGVIVAVVPSGTARPAAPVVHDVDGMLLLPSLVEPHAHLDKALVADTTRNVTGDLTGAMEAMGLALTDGEFTHDQLIARASRALDALVVNGVTTVRTHVNVGETIGAAYVRAIVELRRRVLDFVEIEIVALTHTPLSGSAGAANRAALAAAALVAGADVVGACPHLDPDPTGCIDAVLDAAADARVPVDLHTDETLDESVLTLPALARAVQTRGFDLPVAASHCVSLSMQPLATQRSVAAELAAAGISVIPQPATNLYLQGRAAARSVPRAIAPIDVLRDAGVIVAAGGDNMQDPFNPIGRGDPLETAALLVYAAHQEPDAAYRMVSNDARLAIGRAPVEFAVGDRADFVALGQTSVREAIAAASPNRIVFRNGRIVATTTVTTTIERHAARSGHESSATSATLTS